MTFDPVSRLEKPRVVVGTQKDKGLPDLLRPAFGTRLYDPELGTIERFVHDAVGGHWELIGGEDAPPGAPIGQLMQGRVLNNILAALGRDNPGGGGSSSSSVTNNAFTSIVNPGPGGGGCHVSAFSTDTVTINALGTADLGFSLDVDDGQGKLQIAGSGLGIEILEPGWYVSTFWCFAQTIVGDGFTSHGGVQMRNVASVSLAQDAVPLIDSGGASVSAYWHAASSAFYASPDEVRMRIVNRDHAKRIQVKPSPNAVTGFAGLSAYMVVSCL